LDPKPTTPETGLTQTHIQIRSPTNYKDMELDTSRVDQVRFRLGRTPPSKKTFRLSVKSDNTVRVLS
jgi:hypothetical protein